MSFEQPLEEVASDVAREGAEQFRQRAIEILRETGSRLDYDVEPVVQSVTPVTQSEDGYTFSVTHPSATIFEFGSEPHTIEPTDPDGVLAWEQDGETIFAKSVEHPGTEAILYISKAQQELDTRGLTRKRLRSIGAE